MKRLTNLCAVAAAVLLSAAPAQAQHVVTVATLTGGEEAPNKVLTGGAGNVMVSIDVAAAEMAVTLNVFNLPSPTTASHIHIGAPGVAGPVVVDFPIPTGRTGDLSISFRVGASSLRPRPEQGILTMTDVIQAILNGNAYVNVHTVANGPGEIRGQLALRP